jgi:cell division control protein 6
MDEDYPIIVNEDVLADIFVPEKLLHREGQIREIERCLKPALKNKPIENIFLLGTSGTGKTTVIKWILENYFKENSAYVNCWKFRTSYEILREILLILNVPVHGREPTGELIKTIEKVNTKKRIIVGLDEVDRLKDIDLLYVLARGNCGLVLVSTAYHSLLTLTTRIRRSLSLTEIEFPAYTADEIFDILKERVEYGFRPNTITRSLIKLIALAAGGDARVAIEILAKAGKIADSKALEKVDTIEVEEAISQINRFESLYPVQKLNEHQKAIMKILSQYKRMNSGDLYRAYTRVIPNPVVDRAYRKYMKKMVKMSLVKDEGKGRWKIYETIT